MPRHLPVADWGPCLDRLASARGDGAGWWDGLEDRLAGLARAWLRFARADGSTLFGPEGAGPEVRARARAALRLSGDPALARVLDWWLPGIAGETEPVAPPLPADARLDRVLALLRPDWLRNSDLAAVDHRAVGGNSLFELRGQGRRWLGPTWTPADPAAFASSWARPVHWSSTSQADLAEWTFRAGGTTITRTVALFRGRRLALLAEQVDGPGEPTGWRVDLPPGTTARPVPESRAVQLVAPGGRSSALAIPFGLPRSHHAAEGTSILVEDQAMTIIDNRAVRRRWLPLLVSWEPVRNRKALTWRALTVAEQSKACPADLAFAARVSWGAETVVVYRSLGRPGLRSFVGHQTRARFLVGEFDRSGEVTPWLKVEP